MANFKSAARLMRPLLDAIEAEDAEKALAVCDKITAALADEAGDSDEKAQKNPPEFLDTDKKKSLAGRNAQRVKMGLAPIGGQHKAIRVENNTFVFSAAALAQSKGRVRA